MIKVGGQFSGVGAFDQALKRLNIEHDNIYQAEWDKYARQTYLENYTHPKYYIQDVNDTPTKEITEKYGSLDLAMFSPPCQAFSLAGKRLGKADKRGVLFFNSHEFIQVNKPRFFIFENVKGLLSADGGKTFNEWINYLGGKSVNGNPVMFPTDEAVPYHIYWKVLNAKNYNIPQNRERVFIVGIRDDADNFFSWPKELPLQKRLKDVLEDDVPEKYFLSEKMVSYLIGNSDFQKQKGNGFKFTTIEKSDVSKAITTKSCQRMDDNFLKIGTWRTHEDGRGFREMEDNLCPTIPARAREDGSGQPVIQIKSATKSGFETATENDSINFSVPNSETRRGRVGKGVAQTLDTACNQGVCVPVLTPDRTEKRQNGRRFKDDGEEMFTITTQDRHGVFDGYRIRRLTPKEAMRLMDFNPEMIEKTINSGLISDSQLYKQAGNSICVGVLAAIIKNLNL